MQAWDFVNARILYWDIGAVSSECVTSIEWSTERSQGQRGINTRVRAALWQGNVRTLGDVLRMTEREVLRVPNMGHKCLLAIKATLAARGLELRKSDGF